jgi:hypothetical protein
MRKIPTLILALFVLASNFFCAPVFSAGTNQIAVSATVLEHISIHQNNGNIIIETNLKNGFYYFVNNKAYYSTSMAEFSASNVNSLVLVARY